MKLMFYQNIKQNIYEIQTRYSDQIKARTQSAWPRYVVKITCAVKITRRDRALRASSGE